MDTLGEPRQQPTRLTVKELKDKLDQFDDSALILLSSIEDVGTYYESIAIRRLEDAPEFCLIGVASPYTKVPGSLLRTGWRPTSK